MDNAHIIARILGPAMVIFGIWFLTKKELIMEMAKSTGKAWGFHSAGLLYIIVGLTAITLYNVWQWNIYLAVTLIGWVIFIRGIIVLFAFRRLLPDQPAKTHNIANPHGYIAVLWGLLLVWIGYFMK